MSDKLTVGKLIEILSTFPQDMLVVVDGYEGNYERIERENVYMITGIVSEQDQLSDPYVGEFKSDNENQFRIVVVCLSRNSEKYYKEIYG